MTTADVTFIHATALVVREAGVLVRGPSGGGKSRLASLLLEEARRRGDFARLVGDDRVRLRVRAGRVVAEGHPALAGLIERRTQPFGRVPFMARCVLHLVVDLQPPEPPLPRYPEEEGARAEVAGCTLPLLRLQGPPDALSCGFVLEAIAKRLNTVDAP